MPLLFGGEYLRYLHSAAQVFFIDKLTLCRMVFFFLALSLVIFLSASITTWCTVGPAWLLVVGFISWPVWATKIPPIGPWMSSLWIGSENMKSVGTADEAHWEISVEIALLACLRVPNWFDCSLLLVAVCSYSLESILIFETYTSLLVIEFVETHVLAYSENPWFLLSVGLGVPRAGARALSALSTA